jgi:TolB-like protein
LADIFISYARADRDKIASLSSMLEQAGWSVWWDRHIDGGSAFAQAIETELEASKVVIVAWSQTALRSDWVKDEAAAARDQGKLVPVSLDGSVAPLGFRQYHAIDLSAWSADTPPPAFADLRRSIEARFASAGLPPPRGVTGTAPPQYRAADTSASPAATRRTRRLVLAGLGCAALVAALAFAYRWVDSRSTAASAPAAVAPASAAAGAGTGQGGARDKSIAVLPFDNRSAQADDAYFAAGMHDDLLAQLAKVPDLRVTSRTSVLRYADTAKPIREIAAELGVGVVLEGAVQRAGNRVRINVQLIDGRSDTHLWAETFDRELTVANLFEIQSEITRAIAGELKSVLDAPGKPAAEKLPTESTEAYNAWLRGNSLNLYWQIDPEQIRRAALAYGEAVAIDPQFAEAYARKAVAHLTLAWWGVDVVDNTRLAGQALERARALAPDSSETQTAEAYQRYWIKGDYAGADAAVRAAIEQSPQDARLWRLHAATARRAGDMAASTAAWERVLEIDPKDADAAGNLAYNHAYLGRLAEAQRWLARAWALAPDLASNRNVEANLLLLSGDVDRMWRRYEEWRDVEGLDPDGSFTSLAVMPGSPARLEVLASGLAGEQFPGLFGLESGLARARALDRLGRTAEARALAQELEAQLSAVAPPNPDRARRARMLAVGIDALTGDTAAASKGAAVMRRDPPRDHLWLVEMAPDLMTAYAEMGEPDAAFDLVEQAMDRLSPVHFMHVRNNVRFDPYRDLPRYRKLDARYEAWKAAQPPAG